MTDRSFVARLRADASQFLATMAQAKKATEAIGQGAEKSAKQADSAFSRMTKKVQANSADIDRLGNTALVAGGAIAAGLGVGVKAFADFDEAMSSVNAALPEAAAQMGRLRQLAIDLGKDSQFSSTEAAEGITELAKAGVDANAILGGGLKGSLDLAAAGQLDVARAAEVSATALKQFNLEGADLVHVADLYSAAAGKAQGSVEDIAQAMKFAGVTANGLGISLDETVGTLGLFAEAGIIGEQAGTSLRSLLLSLTAPSEQAAKKMAELGISVYDAQGNFIGIGGAAEQLRVNLGKVDEATRNAALGTIFGNEAINAARELYEGGATSIAKWTGQVNDAGFAAEQAAAKTDNLKGDIERLGGALDAVFVQNGDGINGALRGMVQNVEGAVETFGNLPAPAQQGALALAGLTGASLLAVGAFAKVVTTGADLAESMDAIRTRSPKVAKGLDAVSRAARGYAVAVAAAAAVDILIGGDSALPVQELTKELLDASDATKAFDAAIRDLKTGSDGLDDTLRSAIDPSWFEDAQHKASSFIETATIGMVSLGEPVRIAEERLSELDAVLSSLESGGRGKEAARIFDDIARAAAAQGLNVDELRDKLPQYSEALAGTHNAQKLAAGSADGVREGMSKIESAAADAKDEVEDLASEIRGFGNSAIAADAAESRFRDSIDDVTKTVKNNAQAVKDGEITKAQATRDNRDALRDLAEAAKENSAATFELTGSAEDARTKLEEGRTAFIKAAGQMGITGEAAEDLADRYGLIPADISTTITAKGGASARRSVQELIDTINRLNSKTVTLGVRYVYSGVRPGGGRSLGGGLTIDADGGMHVGGPHGLVRAYANGGMWDGSLRQAQPQIARAGGRGILWAEEGAGPWEAFISGHPAKLPRSRMIAEDTVSRLGGRIDWQRFANGGFLGGPTSEEHDNSVTIEGDLVLPSANLREVRMDVRHSSSYLAKRRPGR